MTQYVPHTPERQWTVYLIHHTHTDIGYTATQERILRYHLQYLDDVLRHYKNWKEGDSSLNGFVWTNECFWSIEQWLKSHDEKEHLTLVNAIRDGFIGLTGGYLHFNELIDFPLLQSVLSEARNFADQHRLPLNTALHADINGFSWGYCQALHDAGITNMIEFLHSHHGLSPLNKRQTPFWWESPKGDRILVWNGELYMLGNGLGLVPGAMCNYSLVDEFTPQHAETNNLPLAEIRLPRYLRQLELDGYPQDFVVVGIGGTISDNAPPHFGLPEFIQSWNVKHGHHIRLEMTTPSAYMANVREHWKDIPVHRGDWPDWWSDGFSSFPTETGFYREGQRRLERLNAARNNLSATLPTRIEKSITYNLAMYAEHTFSHSDAMKTPWNTTTKHIESGKKRYAGTALFLASDAEDDLTLELGKSTNHVGRGFTYKIINPFDYPLDTLVPLYIEYPDYKTRELAPRVVNLEDGKELITQKTEAPRGWNFLVGVQLPPGETLHVELQEGIPTLSHSTIFSTDSLPDNVAVLDAVSAEDDTRPTQTVFHSESAKVHISPEAGIFEWMDPVSGYSLLDSSPTHPFLTPVYERTPVHPANSQEEQLRVRAKMGRNRKGENVERHAGVIKKIQLHDDGPHYATYQIDYTLPGTSMAEIHIQFYKDQPRADFSMRVHKDSVWDPENLYLALPLSSEDEAQLWLHKSGTFMRPVLDQLPNTLTDWYCVQSGYAVCRPGFGIAVACLDAPLLQLGPLEHGMRQTASDHLPERSPKEAYSWLMNNYWETNFGASLGGFYEFRYRMQWGPSLAEPETALNICRQLSQDPFVFRT